MRSGLHRGADESDSSESSSVVSTDAETAAAQQPAGLEEVLNELEEEEGAVAREKTIEGLFQDAPPPIPDARVVDPTAKKV